jgi:hypothetical protein
VSEAHFQATIDDEKRAASAGARGTKPIPLSPAVRSRLPLDHDRQLDAADDQDNLSARERAVEDSGKHSST